MLADIYYGLLNRQEVMEIILINSGKYNKLQLFCWLQNRQPRSCN